MGRWYQHGFHNPIALTIVFRTIPNLPRFLHPPIAAVTALIFLVLLKKERTATIKNLSHIHRLGRFHQWWKAYKVFYSFCDFIVSYCYVPGASHAQLESMLTDPDRGADTIDRCLKMGNGLIVWTAHLGNWEYASRLLEMHGVQVHVARVVERDNPAEVMLRNLMQNNRLNVVELNGDILASVKLLHALRGNEIVAIQGDRIYNSYCGTAKFFGEQTRFPLGPFLLSYITGAPVVPGFIIREKWLRYRVLMGDPILIARTDDREKDLRAALEQAIAFLEKAIKAHSDQWMNFFDFWSIQAPLRVAE